MDKNIEMSEMESVEPEASDLSEIKRQEAESEERIKLMLDSTPLCCQLWDSNFKKIDCNKEAILLFGFKDKEDFLKRSDELYPEFQPDGRRSTEKAQMFLRQTVEEGRCYFDWTYKLMDGTLMPASATFVRVSHGDSYYIAGYTRDMREHHRMMDEINKRTSELEIQKSTLQDIINSIPDLVFCKDSNYRYTHFNTACADFLNAEMESIIGKNDAELGFPDVVIKTMRSSDDSIYAGEDKIVYDSWIPSPKGHFRYYETSKAPIIQGGAIVGLVGVSRDITEKHLMEKKLEAAFAQSRTRAKELIEVQKMNELQLSKLNLMVRATKIGLWDMEVVEGDPVNPANFFVWSDELRHMLGFVDENDFPNILSSWSDRLHPEDKEGILDAFEKHLTDKTGKTPYNVEYRLLKKDGEYAYFRASGETIRDENGNPLRIAGALMDVTETKNMLFEIEKKHMEAEAANKAKSDFLSMISHEIRSPMNVILGVTEIQLQSQRYDHSLTEAFDRIYASGDLLLGIINDILDLSKIEAGKLELFCDKYEMTSLISDAAQLNVMRIGNKPIEFEIRVDENTPAVLFGDELRIKQVLNNLLSNAFKYTEAGTVRLSIHAEADGDDDDVATIVYSVSDTGQGMTEEELGKLFDEYSRFNTDANRTTEGTGLGMSIVRNLVRIMDGKVDIYSAKGKGTTVTVWLPQKKTSSDVLGSELAKSLQQFRTSGRAQMKRAQISREQMPYGSVLVVDDVESNIYVTRGLLIPYGLKIDTASSGFEAIDKIKNGSLYDVVFMDHMMPEMDGLEATRIIRGLGYKKPIVALTANAVIGQADVFMRNGFDDFIPKPIDMRQLNSILNKLIRDRHPQEAIEAAQPQAIDNIEQLRGDESDASIDPLLIEAFIDDALYSIAALESINEKQYPLSAEDNRLYSIHMHGMKSALMNVRKHELSKFALKLERAAQDGETDLMATETTAFLSSLREVVDELALG